MTPRRLGRVAVLTAAALLLGLAPAALARWHPGTRFTWYWQLDGRIPNSVNASVYDVDGFNTKASEVAALHKLGKRVVCYIDIGTWENWRPDAKEFPISVRGESNGWPGERWLDIRRLSALKPIMTRRLQMCARKHFDALEPDNMDGYSNQTGFKLTAKNQLAYDEWLAGEAHRLGLAVFEKNDPEQARQLEPHFDGALDEQCNQYSECGAYRPYLKAGKPVLNAEYKASLFPGFCASDGRLGIMGVLYNLDLNGRLYKPCWASANA
jgi:hypothetical protein